MCHTGLLQIPQEGMVTSKLGASTWTGGANRSSVGDTCLLWEDEVRDS